MSTSGQILKSLRLQENMQQKDLAKKLHTTASNVGHWENSRRKIPSELLPEIADIFNVSTDYLLGRSENIITNLYISDKPKTYIPLINVSAGKFYSDDTQYDESIELPESLSYLKGQAFAIKINGESMNKVMQDGSIALCEDIAKTGYKITNGDYVVAEQHGEYTVKKFIETSTMIILDPVSTDSSFEPIVFNKDNEFLDLNILGVVKRNYIDFD